MLRLTRAEVAWAAVGNSVGAYEAAVKYGSERVQFGKPIASFQGMQFQLAQMAIDVETAKLMVYNAARLKDAGKDFVKEAAMAKMSATESAQMVIDATVQMFGGLGVMRGNIAEKLYREIRALRIYEGATEVQKLIIARAVLAA